MMLNRFSRILVVDDSLTARKIIRQMFERLGYENIDDATDGRTALAKMRTRSYVLVVSDWAMEPMTGIDLLKTLRRSEAWKNVAFIMVTAMAQKKFADVARDQGTTLFLAKPFTFEAFADKIARLQAGGVVAHVTIDAPLRKA